MLEKEHPDLISVGTRWSSFHHAMVLAALQSGAHVYCEKPFTETLAEADDLLAVADRMKLKICVSHQLLLAPALLFLKQSLAEGAIGDLLEIHIYGKQDRRAGGEDMLVLGIHQFDLARFIAGDPAWCTARIRQSGHEATASDIHPASEKIGPILGDEVEAIFAFPRGVNVFFTSRGGYLQRDRPFVMEVVGKRGTIRMISGFAPRLLIRHSVSEGARGEREEWLELPGAPAPGGSDIHRELSTANRRLLDDWLEAIDGDREPICSGRAAMRALEMVHAAFAAGLSGGRVSIPLRDRRHLAGAARLISPAASQFSIG